MRFRWLTACLLWIPVAGCDGKATTDTLPWSCNESCNSCPETLEPVGLAGFWRFDGPDLGGTWRGTNGAALAWRGCNDGQGGDWVASNAGVATCGTERLGGLGGSLRLSGNGYVEGALTEGSAKGPLTLGAWVSLFRSTTQRMTVVSVARSSCQSAWLNLATDDRHRQLILSTEKPIAGSNECEVEESTAYLPSGFLDWGLGNWYHVAAVTDPDEPLLFVDGLEVSLVDTARHQQAPDTDDAVHIGADPAGGGAFSGLIDDVAVFSRPLDRDELETFVSESTSVRSDGQQWTAWSADGSTATWKGDCSNPDVEPSQQGASVVIQNGYWSAGGILTRIHNGHRIGSLKRVTLVADIPDEESFDFVLGSRHNAERCTWHSSGTGKGRYEFDLDDVKHCDCPSTCNCSFTVEEARVGSRWDENGTLEFSVCRVELEWEPVDESQPVELTPGPGGKKGLNGWCWRPISYHQNALADLDEDLTNADQTVGTLSGGNRQTSYLAADFAFGEPWEAAQLCDLSQAEAITVHADMPQDFSYQLRIADFNGIGREWSHQWDRAKSTQTFALCDPEESSSGEAECGRNEDPIPYRGRSVNLAGVRYLGIQKTFEFTSKAAPISIDKVEFTGPVRGTCALSTSSGGAGPE